MTDIAKKTSQTKQSLFQKIGKDDWKISDLRKVLNALDMDIKFEIIDKTTEKPVVFKFGTTEIPSDIAL